MALVPASHSHSTLFTQPPQPVRLTFLMAMKTPFLGILLIGSRKNYLRYISDYTVTSFAELLRQTINEIGAEKWAAICSDSTAVTKNSRREIVTSIPTMLDFNDVCHHLHNTIKDITTLECFRWVCEPYTEIGQTNDKHR